MKELILPEYGRNIQNMVEIAMTIEDRAERNRCARSIINCMGNLFPYLRDNEAFQHKLWDHLFIMSDFRLDVDSPYARPKREDLLVKPEPLPYPQSYISHKHYGKNIVRMLRRVAAEGRGESSELGNIARYMRARSAEYNNEHPNVEVLLNDIQLLSDGVIKVDEECLRKAESDHKSALSHYRNAKQQRQQQRQQKGQQKGQRKNGQRHNSPKQ